MLQAEEDVADLIRQLSSRQPGQQLMMVNTNYMEDDFQGWTVHYINETGSCGLGEVDGKYIGMGRTLAAALLDCLGNYDRRWTAEMDWAYRMVQPIGDSDEQ